MGRTSHPICGIGQGDSNTISRHLGPLARHHICKLQPVLGFERDGFHLPGLLRTVGIVRNFSDFGASPAVFGADDDF
jgi:hypothetical protein